MKETGQSMDLHDSKLTIGVQYSLANKFSLSADCAFLYIFLT